MKFKKNRGFSLLELLIIILIIALLVAVAIPQFADFKLRSQRAKAKQDIDVIVNAIALFEQEESTTLWDYARVQDLSAFTSNERTILNLLVGPYLKKLPADPWGNSYIVDVECGYVLSRGKNGIELQTDVLYDQDIKVFYGAKTLTIKKAEYVDVSNDGVVTGDKLYVYFTQVINFATDATDLAGTIVVGPPAVYYDTRDNAGAIADDDNAAGTADAAAATDFDWLIFRKNDGTASTAAINSTYSIISGYKDDGLACNYNTNVLIFTFAGTAEASTISTDIKAGALVTLGAPADLIPCDLTVGTAAVAPSGYGVPVSVGN